MLAFSVAKKGLETTDNVSAEIINKVVPLENILNEVFFRCFVFEENNSYEDLLEVIKNRYSSLTGCVCNYHAIKKRVTDSVVSIDIAAQGAIRTKCRNMKIEDQTPFFQCLTKTSDENRR